MTLRPLSRTVAPLPDELLSGWLSRLAASNHCEIAELLTHIGIDTRHVATLDFEVEAVATVRFSIAGRVVPETVQSMTFAAKTKTELMLTAQVPFQTCPACSPLGPALKHWRRAWAFDCEVCGSRLLPILAKQNAEPVPKKLVGRARRGAGLFERAAKPNCEIDLRRAMWAVTFAKGLKSVRGDPAFALQSPRPDVRLFCLAALAAAQSRPPVKAAMFSIGMGDCARVCLLLAYEKEPRLLAAVDQIARRKRKGTSPPAERSHI